MSDENSVSRSLYDKFLDFLCYINTVATGVALVFLTVIFGWLVFGRYVLNSTPTWVEQVALLLVVYTQMVWAMAYKTNLQVLWLTHMYLVQQHNTTTFPIQTGLLAAYHLA